jgi:hypothetical protein
MSQLWLHNNASRPRRVANTERLFIFVGNMPTQQWQYLPQDWDGVFPIPASIPIVFSGGQHQGNTPWNHPSEQGFGGWEFLCRGFVLQGEGPIYTCCNCINGPHLLSSVAVRRARLVGIGRVMVACTRTRSFGDDQYAVLVYLSSSVCPKFRISESQNESE